MRTKFYRNKNKANKKAARPAYSLNLTTFLESLLVYNKIMGNEKEIFIEIDESGTFNELPSKSKDDNYFFLTCSFISDSLNLQNLNNPFHYKDFVFSPNIEKQVKTQTLIGLATKIEKQNVFYSMCKINKSHFTDETYEYEGLRILEDYFYGLLEKLTKNNNLSINVFYDKGQKPVAGSLYLAIKRFKEKHSNKISFVAGKSPSHGYADYLASIEKAKIKKENNSLGKIETELYKDGLLENITTKIDKKNIDKIKFDNFENLLSNSQDNELDKDEEDHEIT